MKKSKAIFISGLVLSCIALIGLIVITIYPFGSDHEQNLKIIEMGIKLQVLGVIGQITLLIGSILISITKE
jgi:hypothetical protein